MTTSTAPFDLGESSSDALISPKLRKFIIRFFEHALAAGAPPFHISTMGAVLSLKNSDKE